MFRMLVSTSLKLKKARSEGFLGCSVLIVCAVYRGARSLSSGWNMNHSGQGGIFVVTHLRPLARLGRNHLVVVVRVVRVIVLRIAWMRIYKIRGTIRICPDQADQP